jgi:tripartite-type tricarboxylate transporter receptor subunit TctC
VHPLQSNARPSDGSLDIGAYENASGVTTFTVSGTITIGAAGLSGVAVSDGTRSATTDASGNYSIASVPNVMQVNPAVPAQSVSEFIAYAKANPGKVNMASGGNGSPAHVSGELFKIMTGVNMLHVPYRGDAPAFTDLLGGQVQVYFPTTISSIEHIKTGRLRGLAVTTAARAEALPDLPTVGDFLPGYEASTWNGVVAPKNTPAEIVDTLNREINQGLASSTIKARLADLGGTVLPGSPADFGKLIADETEKWAKVVKFASIKPE